MVRAGCDVSVAQLDATLNILALDGEIDLHLSPEVAASLRAIIIERPSRVIVDLGRVTFVDSSGLAVLIDGMRDTEKYGGEFSLAAMPESVRQIFELAGLDQIFTVFPDMDRARAGLANSLTSEPSRLEI